MNIIHNNYFLSNLFFKDPIIQKNHTVINLDSLPKTWLNLFFKIPFINNILAYIICTTYNRNTEEKLFLFGIGNIQTLARALHYNSSKNISLFLWNKINPKKLKTKLFLSTIKKFKITVYTFDPSDAKKYNFNYTPQIFSSFAIEKSININNSNEIESDFAFIGYDKGRFKTLKDLSELLKNSKFNIKIIKDKTSKDINHHFYTDTPVLYEEYLNIIRKSNCLLELSKSGQSGVTIRILEALYLNKKVITNNKDVINYDFYHVNNILILKNSTSKQDIMNFLSLPFDIKAARFINNYEIKMMIESVQKV